MVGCLEGEHGTSVRKSDVAIKQERVPLKALRRL